MSPGGGAGVEHPTVGAVNLNIGDLVWVHSFGAWYPGTIAKTSPARVWVSYRTGSGTHRVKPYSRADGRLAPRSGLVPPAGGTRKAPGVR
jgi:hypothetical protein